MIDSESTTKHHCAPKIIDGKICAPLVIVLDEREASRLASLLVSCHVYRRWVPVLGEDGENVALVEVEW